MDTQPVHSAAQSSSLNSTQKSDETLNDWKKTTSSNALIEKQQSIGKLDFFKKIPIIGWVGISSVLFITAVGTYFLIKKFITKASKKSATEDDCFEEPNPSLAAPAMKEHQAKAGKKFTSSSMSTSGLSDQNELQEGDLSEQEEIDFLGEEAEEDNAFLDLPEQLPTAEDFARELGLDTDVDDMLITKEDLLTDPEMRTEEQ